jgi:hypothetical protein
MTLSKQLVERRIRWWIPRLQLQAWDITVSLGPIEVDAAECDASPEYLNAAIRLDPAKVPDADLEAYVVHELLHCHTWGLTHAAEVLAGTDPKLLEWVRKEQESLCTALERVFLHLKIR